MADDHDLHPDARAFRERTDDGPSLHELPVSEARAQRRNALGSGDPEPVGAVEDRVVRGAGHGIPVRLYRPEGAGPFPVLVWAHGGGFALGDIETEDPVARALANAGDCVVASVDYRLAPEHPFPAPLRDVTAVLEWVDEDADALGAVDGDSDRLAVGGQSAGANLAAASALWARDEGGPALDYQVLVVPAVGYTPESGSGADAADLEWTAQGVYLEDPLIGRNPYAYPLEADEFGGLPPATVVTAGFDDLLPDGEAYRDALDSAGVDVAHHHFADMIHVFFGRLQDPEWERAREAVEAVGDDLRSRLG